MITSTRTTTIPGMATPSTPDSLGFEFHTQVKLPSTGITGSAMVKFTRYRANTDGTNPTPVGDDSSDRLIFSDLFAQAASEAGAGDARLATILTLLEAYLQSKVTSAGL